MSSIASVVLGVLALLLAVVAIVLATVANRRWAARGTWPGGADAGAGGGAVGEPEVDPLAELRGKVTALGEDLSVLRSEVEQRAANPAHDPTALRHVALVRYDAFGDVGGRLSYSVALLDDTRSGLVLTTLAGKSEVRTYVRTISAGDAEGTLTAEEQQAIEAAAGRTGSRP